MLPKHPSLRALTAGRASSLVLASLLLAAPSPAQEALQLRRQDLPVGGPAVERRPAYAQGEILVRYRGDSRPGSPAALDVEARQGLQRMRFNGAIGVFRYRLPGGVNVAEGLRRLRQEPAVEIVEPNWIVYLDSIPNDSFYDNYNAVANDLQKWYFGGIGADRNLNAEAAWDLTTGRSDVAIAVIDTGIDLDHPDLAANIWVNPGEIAGNGLDDDGNGFIDDVNGWDFYNNDGNPNPDLGDGVDNDFFGGPDSNVFHGTFSASCAGAVGNNAAGMTGAAWTCRLMALKVFTDDGGAFTSDINDAITYAANNGAAVANMSFGSGSFSSSTQAAVNYAWSQGVVQVASAGNGNSSAVQYPATYAHVISVGATDSGSVYAGGSGDIDGRAAFSQYGPSAVDVVAAGDDVVGCGVESVADGSPGTPYYTLSSGTSFSSPIVAGLAGLVIARARDLGAPITNDEVESIILTTAADMPDDPNDAPNAGATWDGNGRVDFLAAVGAVTVGGNNPPVADAGPDQGGLAGQVLTFDGSGSSDPDLDPLTYSWDFGDGSPAQNGAVVTHAYAAAGSYVATLTVSDGSLFDTDTAAVTITAVGGGPTVYFSSLGTVSYPGLASVADEDIAAYDTSSGAYSLFFDGSDVGLAGATIDGFSVLAGGDLLVSLSASFSIPGMTGGPGGSTTADDSDIVRFTPSSLGTVTSGVWSFHFDGSDVGLTANDEDVDAVGLDASGNILISIVGAGAVSGVSSVADEDILRFNATSLGSATAGSFSVYFDGSDVGLTTNNEDVDAVHVGSDGTIYLSTLGGFSVSGAAGTDEDVLAFAPTTLGATTSGTYSLWLDGSAAGMPGAADITSLSIDP